MSDMRRNNDNNDKCPWCGSKVYRGSRHGKQVYKCNDLTDRNCTVGRTAIARTKKQLRRLNQIYKREEYLE